MRGAVPPPPPRRPSSSSCAGQPVPPLHTHGPQLPRAPLWRPHYTAADSGRLLQRAGVRQRRKGCLMGGGPRTALTDWRGRRGQASFAAATGHTGQRRREPPTQRAHARAHERMHARARARTLRGWSPRVAARRTLARPPAQRPAPRARRRWRRRLSGRRRRWRRRLSGRRRRWRRLSGRRRRWRRRRRHCGTKCSSSPCTTGTGTYGVTATAGRWEGHRSAVTARAAPSTPRVPVAHAPDVAADAEREVGQRRLHENLVRLRTRGVRAAYAADAPRLEARLVHALRLPRFPPPVGFMHTRHTRNRPAAALMTGGRPTARRGARERLPPW